MNTFKVDNEKVKESVEVLKKILSECEELYHQDIPESDIDKGLSHNELYELCQKIKLTCQYFGELINNTILFLGESSEMFDLSDKYSASKISSYIKWHTGFNYHTGNNHKPPTIMDNIKDIQDVFKYIDKQYSKMPMWLRENLKSLAKKACDSGVDAYEVASMLINGDFEGAIKKFNKSLSDEAGDAISTIVTGASKLTWSQKLLGKYVVNSVWGGVEAYSEYFKKPTLTNLGNVVWSSTVGSVLKTAGDSAYKVVSHIPGISDYYESKGATDMESMFNIAYSEWTGAIFGKDVGDYVSTYYADNGGLFKGLVNGFSTIKDEVEASCAKHGGLLGVWKSGWNSIFD